MDRATALQTAAEFAKLAVQSNDTGSMPGNNYADSIADFIETLANRLEKIG